jgi:hypothetical protein
MNSGYRLRLPVAIDTADGQRRIETVEVAGPRTRFQVKLPARAVRLVLDPSADFVLESAEERTNPWTLELPASAPSVTRRPEAPTADAPRTASLFRRYKRVSQGPDHVIARREETLKPPPSPSKLLPLTERTTE